MKGPRDIESEQELAHGQLEMPWEEKSLFNLQHSLSALAVLDRFTGQSKPYSKLLHILKYCPLKIT